MLPGGGAGDRCRYEPGAPTHNLALPSGWSWRGLRRAVLVVIRCVPIGHPLPDVSRHIIRPIPAFALLIAPHGGRPGIPVIAGSILPSKGAALVTVIHPHPIDAIAPGVDAPL